LHHKRKIETTDRSDDPDYPGNDPYNTPKTNLNWPNLSSSTSFQALQLSAGNKLPGKPVYFVAVMRSFMG
jgi:hypothetical protein